MYVGHNNCDKYVLCVYMLQASHLFIQKEYSLIKYFKLYRVKYIFR
jgi:hypothetical protein